MLAPRHLDQAARALREGTNLRAVVRARIGAVSGEEARRARFALEDALNTADFGDCGRLIVIRALSLGRLPAGASGSTVARALEQAWRDIAHRAVAFSASNAAEAPAVYFTSLAQAQIAYVRAIAHGEAEEAWFWPRVLPELSGAPNAAHALVPIFLSIESAAAASLAADTVHWQTHALTRLEALLPPSIPAAVQVALDRLVFVGSSAAQAGPGDTAADDERVRMDRIVMLRDVAAALPALRVRGRGAPALPIDWRRTWVSGLLLRGALGRALARATVERAMQASTVRTAAPANDAWHESEATAATGVRRMVPVPPAGDSRRMPPPDTVACSGMEPGVGAENLRRGRMPWLSEARATNYAGLPMLLTVLASLGAARWISAQRRELADVFARAWLEALSDRLAIAHADGIRAAFETTPEERGAFARGRMGWTDFSWPAWCDAPLPRGPISTSHSLAAWRVAARRSLRRHAGIGIASLCRRPGLVVVTATHVDVTLPLDAADLRLRRHGLDRDPGWVPWFGRIVAFHFAGPEILGREADHA